MKKVDIAPFSNGAEFAIWNDRNCEDCIKASRYKGESDAGGRIRPMSLRYSTRDF